MFKVATICGSLRTGSYNRALMNALPSLAPPGFALQEAPPIDTIPHYNADLQEREGIPAAVTALSDAIRAADGVIIVTPEYNWTIPGTLKNALDWLSRVKDKPFDQKPVAIQSAARGPIGGARMQYHLRMALTYLNCFVLGPPEVFVSFVHTKFDETTMQLTDEATRKIVAQQLEAFAKLVDRLKG